MNEVKDQIGLLGSGRKVRAVGSVTGMPCCLVNGRIWKSQLGR
jgi:hypothetical protein